MKIDKTKIKELREAAGMTITELAKLSGLSRAYVSQVESGKSSNPSINSLRGIAQALKRDMVDFVEDSRSLTDSEKKFLSGEGVFRWKFDNSGELQELTEKDIDRAEAQLRTSPKHRDVMLAVWLQSTEMDNARAVMAMAVRCGYRGEQPLADWLSLKAKESDCQDVHTVAKQCGFIESKQRFTTINELST